MKRRRFDPIRALRWANSHADPSDLGGGGGGEGGDGGAPASGEGGAPAGGDPASGAPASGEGGAPAGEGAAPPAPAYPENWREQWSGGDEELSKRLARYATPNDAFKGLAEAQNLIRSKGLVEPFPAEGTEEQQAAWREQNGVPKTPDEYDLTFDDGLVLGEDDMAGAKSFLENVAHKHNLNNEAAKDAVRWYEDWKAEQEQAQQATDIQMRDALMDKLNAEMGGEYRGNMNRVQSLINTMPEDVRNAFISARMPDNTAVFNNEAVIRSMIQWSHEINPAGALFPSDGANVMQSVDDELAKIKDVMTKDRKAYNKDTKMQERYRELLAAKERLGTK